MLLATIDAPTIVVQATPALRPFRFTPAPPQLRTLESAELYVSLRVRSTKYRALRFHIRNRNCGLEYILHVLVLGILGFEHASLVICAPSAKGHGKNATKSSLAGDALFFGEPNNPMLATLSLQPVGFRVLMFRRLVHATKPNPSKGGMTAACKGY